MKAFLRKTLAPLCLSLCLSLGLSCFAFANQSTESLGQSQVSRPPDSLPESSPDSLPESSPDSLSERTCLLPLLRAANTGFLSALDLSKEQSSFLWDQMWEPKHLPKVILSFDLGFLEGAYLDVQDTAHGLWALVKFVSEHVSGPGQLYHFVLWVKRALKEPAFVRSWATASMNQFLKRIDQIGSVLSFLQKTDQVITQGLLHPCTLLPYASEAGVLSGLYAKSQGWGLSSSPQERAHMLGKGMGYLGMEIASVFLLPAALEKGLPKLWQLVSKERRFQQLLSVLGKDSALISRLRSAFAIQEASLEGKVVSGLSKEAALEAEVEAQVADAALETKVETKVETQVALDTEKEALFLESQEGKALSHALGQHRVKALLNHLSQAEVVDFVHVLGKNEALRVVDKFGGEVIAHYGTDFFKTLPSRIDAPLLDHIVHGEGIWENKMSGCHDKARFLQQLQGEGKVLRQISHPTQKEISYIEYQMYKKDKMGKVLQPFTLSTRNGSKLKTVIEGLEKNLAYYHAQFQEALEHAVKTKAFNPKSFKFIGEADGIPYLFFHDQGRIKTIYPEWAPQ